jgi:hypothetical protein
MGSSQPRTRDTVPLRLNSEIILYFPMSRFRFTVTIFFMIKILKMLMIKCQKSFYKNLEKEF